MHLRHLGNKKVGILLFLFLSALVLLLVPFSQERREIRPRAVSSANTQDANPNITGLVLPSVLGFQSDLFSGAATVSYPFNLPAGTGGLRPNLSLSYSSGSVDDLHLGISEQWRFRYVTQAQQAGLGWNLTGIDSITKNKDGQYFLTVGGASYKVSAEEPGTVNQTWHTSPQSFLRISHDPANWGQNEWIVTAKDGTKYFFGSNPSDKAYTLFTPPENRYTQVQLVYRWMLTKIQDTHGNTVSFAYEPEMTEIKGDCFGCIENGEPGPCSSAKSYVSSLKPKTITWSANNLYQADLTWEGRPDRAPEGVFESGLRVKECEQIQFSRTRLKGITVKAQSQVLRDYALSYRETQVAFGSYGEIIVRHSLLDRIAQSGRPDVSPAITLPPYTFGYQGDKADGTNDKGYEAYLAWADNGYGGKVSYTYEDQLIVPEVKRRDGSGAVCAAATPASCGKERARVKERLTEDGQGGSFKNSLSYSDNGLGYLELDKDLREKNYQFLGFANAENTLYEVNQPAKAVSKARQFFYRIKNLDDTHFHPDPRQGKTAKTEVRDGTGKLFTTTNQDWRYMPEPTFNPVNGTMDPYYPLTYLDNSQTTVDGITTKVSYAYDDYANPRQTIEEGDISKTGDEKYTETAYYHNTDAWIVNKPKTTALYRGMPGAVPAQVAPAAPASQGNWLLDALKRLADLAQIPGPQVATTAEVSRTSFSYDNRDFGALPARGDLTLADKVGSDNPGLHLKTKTSYDDYGNPTDIYDPEGYIKNYSTQTVYDPAYHLFPLSVTNPLGQTTTTTYDYVSGVPLQVVDINGVPTDFRYDALGRLKKVIRLGDTEEKPTTEYVFREETPMVVGTKSRIESGAGDTLDSYQFYNGLGQLVQSQSPSSTAGQITVSTNTYNSRGAVAEKPIPYSQYAAIGAYLAPDTGVKKTITEYDALGRATRIINVDGTSTATEYAGLTKTITNEADVKKVMESDAYGNLVKLYEFNQPGIADPGSSYATTSYTYDIALGLLTNVTDTQGNLTTIIYDNLGRKKEMTDPDLGRWQYPEYDLNGNLKKQIDAKNQAIGFDYDKLNRLEKKTYPDGTSVNYTYDEYSLASQQYGRGRRTNMTDASGSTHTKYDQRGRVREETKTISGGGQTNTFTSTYAYDNLGRIKTATDADGEILGYGYDLAGNPQALAIIDADGNPLSQLVKNTAYNALGQIKTQDYGNNTVNEYTYNADHLRLESIKNSGPAKTFFWKTYQYDPGTAAGKAGNITAITDKLDSSQSEHFSYDYLSRLTDASSPHVYAAHYEYDNLNRMGIKNEGARQTTLGYTDSRPLHAPKSVNNFNYQYDANGNLTQDEARENITYDFENRPVSMKMRAPSQTPTVTPAPTVDCYNLNNITDCSSCLSCRASDPRIVWCENLGDDESPRSGCFFDALTCWANNGTPKTDCGVAQPLTIAFSYDGDGARVAKTEGDKTTLYAGNIEKNLQTGVITRYYSLGGQEVAVKEGSNLSYLAADHLGSTRVITSAQGAKTNEVSYYPYGQIRTELSSGTLPSRQYTGQINDKTTGLYFYNARYYNPENGVFISADTAGDKPNRYAYVSGNPIMFNDPSGNDDEKPEEQENKCEFLFSCKYEQKYYDPFNEILFNRGVHYIYKLMFDLGFTKDELVSLKSGTLEDVKAAYVDIMKNARLIDGLNISHDPEITKNMLKSGAQGMYDPGKHTIYVAEPQGSASKWDYKTQILYFTHELLHHYQLTDPKGARAGEDLEAEAYALSYFITGSRDVGDFSKPEALRAYGFGVGFFFHYLFSPRAEYELQRIISPNEY